MSRDGAEHQGADLSGLTTTLGRFGGLGWFGFFNRIPIPKNNNNLPETLAGDELL